MRFMAAPTEQIHLPNPHNLFQQTEPLHFSNVISSRHKYTVAETGNKSIKQLLLFYIEVLSRN